MLRGLVGCLKKRLLSRHNIPHPAISLAAESEAVLHPGLGWMQNFSLEKFWISGFLFASLQEREPEPELGVGML